MGYFGAFMIYGGAKVMTAEMVKWLGNADKSSGLTNPRIVYTDYTKLKSKSPAAFEDAYNNVMRFFPKSQLYSDIGRM